MKNNQKSKNASALQLNKKSISKFKKEAVTGGAISQNTCKRSVCVTCHTQDWSK